MLEFGDKTLLQRQLEAYQACGITEISVVRGYKKDKIDYEGLKYSEQIKSNFYSVLLNICPQSFEPI